MVSRDDDQSTTGRRTGDIRRVYGGSELHFELTDVAYTKHTLVFGYGKVSVQVSVLYL